MEQVWEKYNGNLRPRNKLFVDIGGVTFSECFNRLFFDESYVLILTPLDIKTNTYKILEPPAVSNQNKKFRQTLWNRLCAPPGMAPSSCEMRITAPPKVVYFQGQMHTIICKVDSSSPVTHVEWYKDGSRLETNKGIGIVLNTEEADFSFLTFDGASQMHKGKYACQATNEAMKKVTAYVNVQVVGPVSTDHLHLCSDQTYCHNNGTCRQYDTGIKRCECETPFIGDRCEEVNLRLKDVAEETRYEEITQKVFNLTTALTAVSITLFFSLLFLIPYTMKLRRKISSSNLAVDLSDVGSLNSNLEKESNDFLNCDKRQNKNHVTAASPKLHPIEFLPLRILSQEEDFTSLPSLHHKTNNDTMSLRIPVDPITPQQMRANTPVFKSVSSFASSPYMNVRRERLNGKSLDL